MVVDQCIEPGDLSAKSSFLQRVVNVTNYHIETKLTVPVLQLFPLGQQQLQEMIVCPGTIWSLAWSPDGTKLATSQFQAVSERGSVCLWDVGDGVRLIREIPRRAWRVDHLT